MKLFRSPLKRNAGLFVLLLSFSSCFSYRLATKALPSTDITKVSSTPAYSLFWGILNRPQIIMTPNCDSLELNGVSEVIVRRNFGQSMVSLLTLGIYNPVRVEWKCTKPCPPGGDI